MAKKKKGNKKTDMPEFDFKEFTEEESKIYDEAVGKYREAIDAGKNLDQAFKSYAITDQELEKLIQADFLKILIAERHFAGQQSFDQIAGALGVPVQLIKDTHARMLQEVGVTAANQFGQEFGGLGTKTND